MSDKMIDDNGDLRNLEIDLLHAPLRIKLGTTKKMRQAAEIVDVGMREDARGHQGNYFGRPGTSFETPLAEHVSHELLSPVEAEIGIDARGAGKLAHIIVYGSVNNLPVYDHTAALRRSTPAILDLFADMAEESVLGGEK